VTHSVVADHLDPLPLALDPAATKHAFISYGREDASYVHRLVEHLVAANISAWLDDNVECGAAWEAVVCDRIDTCFALIVVMSHHAAGSTWVTNEVTRAQRRNKPILPLLLSGDGLFRLGHLQYVDVTDGAMPGPRFTALLASLRDAG
jgi:hypothetical protein